MNYGLIWYEQSFDLVWTTVWFGMNNGLILYNKLDLVWMTVWFGITTFWFGMNDGLIRYEQQFGLVWQAWFGVQQRFGLVWTTFWFGMNDGLIWYEQRFDLVWNTVWFGITTVWFGMKHGLIWYANVQGESDVLRNKTTECTWRKHYIFPKTTSTRSAFCCTNAYNLALINDLMFHFPKTCSTLLFPSVQTRSCQGTHTHTHTHPHPCGLLSNVCVRWVAAVRQGAACHVALQALQEVGTHTGFCRQESMGLRNHSYSSRTRTTALCAGYHCGWPQP